MKRKLSSLLLFAAMLFAAQGNVMAANTKTTITQVTTTVTLSDDVDYIITGDAPFAGDGLINITNTEHAVLILQNIKPSKASSWLKYVQINGVKAANNSNCQIKFYNYGCIILPYAGGDNFKPLTVYSEKNFEGESCNDFGLEHSDGYMNTLTDAKLNNRIRSFKLKRGYMVTFSLKAGGHGYSRCFIAADKDLEMASLPALMDNSISSYRVFKWYDAGKKQLANDLNTTTMAALDVQSSYTWSEGHNMAPDYECVPNHIYEDYPSSRAIGKATWSPHSKNNNEPRNTSDDHPQDLNTILNNWENMMRTGMRLCSPASWDGSDYWNATGFLAEFLDSIDARGWRCDIIDLHCYWAEGSFGNMHYWSDKYKRPIWISEWCWGASWNHNGAFADGVTQSQVKGALERICTNLNNWDYVERYYYWNGEAPISRLYDGGLTPAGEYYAAMKAPMAYNGKYDFVPKTPKQYAPSNFSVEYDNKKGLAVLKWDDKNGEMNSSMSIMRKAGSGKAWEVLCNVAIQEDAASYTFTDSAAMIGYQYQIVVKDANNQDRKSTTLMATSDELQTGDAIEIDGQTRYLGGNIMVNGSFDMGFYGWLDGKGNTLSAPYFQVIPEGGNDDGAYLQAYGNGNLTSEMALHTVFTILPNTNYYFSVASCNMPSGYDCKLGLSEEGMAAPAASPLFINNTTDKWLTQFASFNSKSNTQARVRLFNLASKAQVDQMMLCQLFSTRDSAIADGIAKVRITAEAFKDYNTKYNYLNEDLTRISTGVTTTDAEALQTLAKAMEDALQAYRYLNDGTLVAYAEKLVALKLHGNESLELILNAAKKAKTIESVVMCYADLEEAVFDYLPYKQVKGKIENPNFSLNTGWTFKTGSYQGGDQRLATHDGVTCWNAWWSGIDADNETQSMAISQDLTFPGTTPMHGLYALECKASTEHYCLSDQHGYITDGTVKENTQNLTADYLDLNMPVAKRWGTLYTAPIYLNDNSTFTVGFEGTKKGSVANGWLQYGKTSGQSNDKREGWWCATDFALRFTPLYKQTVVPNQFGCICLPYAVRASETLECYKIVGINADYTQLCLEEIDETEAGVPFIYRSSDTEALFLEYGDAVTMTQNGPGNLRGYLIASARMPLNYYFVNDGAFEKITSANRTKVKNYDGYMRPFTDLNSEAIPVLTDWTGETMAISGVTEEEKVKNNQLTGINTVVDNRMFADGVYTLDGRSMQRESLRPGLYIKVVGGRMYKTIIK
ncbi:glycoside hydrolase family protein [Prevotella communis]|uniref:glycoside hydrolase family protein n=1 Tax=Prevotella communis TaxID=2913614 RepID=UPI001EDA9CE5|nr:glycoside hydrolase family protein [Prevotella communis]UKK63149.1 glycoside hydrolase family protein [Prevotella communis]UKK65974.1 glycoside hydrolase family protein [Prevotella communis]